MRILFISNLYPPYDMGGWEQNCREIVEYLKMRGHHCHVLTSRWGLKDDLHRSTEEGVTRTLYLQANVNYYKPLDFFLKRPAQERANEQAVRQTVHDFKPDVIFIWGMWLLSTRVAYVAEQLRPGRVAYAIAGYWLMQPDAHEAYWQKPGRGRLAQVIMAPLRFWARRILAQERRRYPLALTHVSCVSQYVRNKLNATGSLPHGAQVVYNGIEPQPFLDAARRKPEKKNSGLSLIYTGGLIAIKGVATALEALHLLQQRYDAKDLHLTLVGSGHPDYEAYLRERVAALQLHEQVAFYGRVPREEIATILADHDVFLFTSTYEEPIARSVMEAMAAKLAVIGSTVGGQVEMLEDGINSLVFPPGDHQQLAKQIWQLKQNPALRQQIATTGQQTVLQRFTLQRMVDEIESWIEEIANHV